MRILSARIRDIATDRARRRVQATVILRLADPAGDREVRVRTAAPLAGPGAAPLRARLIASAKLLVAARAGTGRLPDAEVVRPAA